MGAALKIDPTKVKVAEFWSVTGCPLARALRQRFKRLKRYPKRKFMCVYSDELLENKGESTVCGVDSKVCPRSAGAADGDYSVCSSKAQVNGSLHHITAMFGLMLAGLVIKDLGRQ